MIGRWLKKVVLTVGLLALFITTAVAKTPVTIEWKANPPQDDVAYYTVYYGKTSRVYTKFKNMGNVTEYTIQMNDGMWFIAITATDSSPGKNESGYSKEVRTTTLDSSAPIAPVKLKIK